MKLIKRNSSANENEGDRLVILSDDQGNYWSGSEFSDIYDAVRVEAKDALRLAYGLVQEYSDYLEDSPIYLRAVYADAAIDDHGVAIINTLQAMSWPQLDMVFKREFEISLNREEVMVAIKGDDVPVHEAGFRRVRP